MSGIKNKIAAESFRLVRTTATGAKKGIVALKENLFVGAGAGALVGACLHLYFYFARVDFTVLERYSIIMFAGLGLFIGLLSGLERKRSVSLQEHTRVLIGKIREKERLIRENQSQTRELESTLHRLHEAQDRIIQEGKMASLGSLATGIAHQLNQPLTGIRGFTQIILSHLEPSSRFYRELKTIEEQTTQMMTVIDNLGGFFRMAGDWESVCEINRCVGRALDLVADRLRLNRVAVERRLMPEEAKIVMDQKKMIQMLVNLFLNAEEAMNALPPGAPRRLTIATSRSGGESQQAVITVSDTGVGIPPAIRDRIYDAFFTTKGPSALGLGLYLNYAIVRQHNGAIECESEEGKGTSFRMIFPIASRAAVKR